MPIHLPAYLGEDASPRLRVGKLVPQAYQFVGALRPAHYRALLEKYIDRAAEGVRNLVKRRSCASLRTITRIIVAGYHDRGTPRDGRTYLKDVMTAPTHVRFVVAAKLAVDQTFVRGQRGYALAALRTSASTALRAAGSLILNHSRTNSAVSSG